MTIVRIKTPTSRKDMGKLIHFIEDHEDFIVYSRDLAEIEHDFVDNLVPFDLNPTISIEFTDIKVSKKFIKLFKHEIIS